jgi:hypothetical protein
MAEKGHWLRRRYWLVQACNQQTRMFGNFDIQLGKSTEHPDHEVLLRSKDRISPILAISCDSEELKRLWNKITQTDETNGSGSIKISVSESTNAQSVLIDSANWPFANFNSCDRQLLADIISAIIEVFSLTLTESDIIPLLNDDYTNSKNELTILEKLKMDLENVNSKDFTLLEKISPFKIALRTILDNTILQNIFKIQIDQENIISNKLIHNQEISIELNRNHFPENIANFLLRLAIIHVVKINSNLVNQGKKRLLNLHIFGLAKPFGNFTNEYLSSHMPRSILYYHDHKCLDHEQGDDSINKFSSLIIGYHHNQATLRSIKNLSNRLAFGHHQLSNSEFVYVKNTVRGSKIAENFILN